MLVLVVVVLVLVVLAFLVGLVLVFSVSCVSVSGVSSVSVSVSVSVSSVSAGVVSRSRRFQPYPSTNKTRHNTCKHVLGNIRDSGVRQTKDTLRLSFYLTLLVIIGYI